MTTKEQERQALKKIRKIVDELGKDSYIGMALDGCLEMADENIEYDFGCSMKQIAEDAKKKASALEEEVKQLSKENNRLKKELEDEFEWRDYEDTKNVKQKDYDELKESCAVHQMTDGEALKVLSEWFGFEQSKIKIVKTVPIYQINRHRRLRKIGEAERIPLYNATDWNYIRFDCGMEQYELKDGELRFFID